MKVTKRLSDSPAIVTDHESGALRRMMKMVVSSSLPKLLSCSCCACFSILRLLILLVVYMARTVATMCAYHYCLLLMNTSIMKSHHPTLYYTQEQANAGRKEVDALPAQTMEINPSHPLIVALYQLKDNPGSVS